MEQFAAYGHALTSMAGLALLTLILSPLSAMKKERLGLAPGATPEQDYELAAYRWHRAYLNMTESMGTFAVVIGAAILAGVNPSCVNWLASLYFLSRIMMLVVHVRGIGKPDRSVRSVLYVAGWLMLVLLAISTLVKVF